MATAIEWSDETWNPTVGCSRVSAGCDHCYAIRVASRGMQDAHRGLTEQGGYRSSARAGEVLALHDWTGEVRLLPERLAAPFRWAKPRRVFVDSMSDLFHEAIPDEFIAQVFAVMMLTSRHTYQVLTKRPERMAALMSSMDFEAKLRQSAVPDTLLSQWGPDVSFLDRLDRHEPLLPLPNVWLGTSVETDRYARIRIPKLVRTPAAVRFLSVEPLLGPVDLVPYLELLDWVIVGGESGAQPRPMHPDWVRSIRNQCVLAGVPFFFKQWGHHAPWVADERSGGYGYELLDDGTRMACMGKKAAGRVLDGRTWDEYPATDPRTGYAIGSEGVRVGSNVIALPKR